MTIPHGPLTTQDTNNNYTKHPPTPQAKKEQCHPNCPKTAHTTCLSPKKDSITKITGIITPESINNLENKLGGAFTILKSTHFAKGQRYGFLASMIPQEKYWIVIADPAWVYKGPPNPGTYSDQALPARVSAAQREQIIVQHKEQQTSYADYLGAQEAGKS
jgi:hypothetical protein